MNLYSHRIHHDPARITLKLDMLGTKAKPHFLCSVEISDPGRPMPTCITLFLLSGLYSTRNLPLLLECVQIVTRLGRALILEAAGEGQDAVMARVRRLAEEWTANHPDKTAWEAPGAHAILGQATGLEFEAMRRYRPA